MSYDNLNTKMQYLPEGHFEIDDIKIDDANTPMMYGRNGVKINYMQTGANHPKNGSVAAFLTIKTTDLYAQQYCFCNNAVYCRFRNNGSNGGWKIIQSN